MKILYQLEITEETGFTATDFPDKLEILREGKSPLVFKPVALSMQDIYSRLNEAEALLKKLDDEIGELWGTFYSTDTERLIGKNIAYIDKYFERHSQ